VSAGRLKRSSPETRRPTASARKSATCVFSCNALRDPPFSKLDLISCRNLLIYFGAAFQAQVIPIFHFALRLAAFCSWALRERQPPCQPVCFGRQEAAHLPASHHRRDAAVCGIAVPGFARVGPAVAGRTRPAPADLRRSVEAAVLRDFAPAHVLVNREGDVLNYSARTGKYLEAALARRTGNWWR
jgi:two-component system CheB/CheR fusion protein